VVPTDYPASVAEDWPELLHIVETRVKGHRAAHSTASWWHYERRRPELYSAIHFLPCVIVTNCGAAPQFALGQLSGRLVYANTLAVFAYANLAPFAVLQSRVHEIWARFFSSSMKDDLRYAPSDCFETFPFPQGYGSNATLEAAGQAYHDCRSKLMIDADEGMTKTYNRFHKESERSPPIDTLRHLHDQMDRAVLRAYDWNDLADTLRPQFLTPEIEDDHTYQGRYFWPADQRDIVLSRLLALNAERHAEEIAAGLAPAVGRRARDEDEDDEHDTLGLE
jgi:hypothetical protein